MLKREITYTNFDNVEVTETFCFHLSKAELIELEVETPDGLEAHLTKVSQSQDGKLIIQTMKDLILKSYGIRDGNRFRKSAQIREDFECSEAYSELFMLMATDATAAAEFVVGIMPANLDQDIARMTTVAPPAVEPVVALTEPKTKIITHVDAMKLSREELMAKLTDGYVIDQAKL